MQWNAPDSYEEQVDEVFGALHQLHEKRCILDQSIDNIGDNAMALVPRAKYEKIIEKAQLDLAKLQIALQELCALEGIEYDPEALLLAARRA
jgi:hypothetical protein